MAASDSASYRAIVDMGSNDIRFSITDFSEENARIMPSIFQYRVAISLYDAQWSDGKKVPIPSETIQAVGDAFQNFKDICRDFGVTDDRVTVIATEATRVAINSEEFRAAIKDRTGWTVTLLTKEDEGKVGAMGVASSLPVLNGIMMDLGGGSTQITQLVVEDGEVRTSRVGSVSMPYGAAALTQRLALAEKEGREAVQALKEEIQSQLLMAVEQLDVVNALGADEQKQEFPLYLCGGGFRGIGYLLMSTHPVSPYPIPIINGFRVATSNFFNTVSIQDTASDGPVFRISDRRASQVPAVALLISCLAQALPTVKNVYFCQGGVREGSLYSKLDPTIRAQHPFVVATRPGAPPDTEMLYTDLTSAFTFPGGKKAISVPQIFHGPIVKAFIQSFYYFAPLPKELRAGAALYSTTKGHLAKVHGVDHEERAVLALLLCEGWGGEGSLSPTDKDFYSRLMELLEEEETRWWCMYIARVASAVAAAYPSGRVHRRKEFTLFHASHEHGAIHLRLVVQTEDIPGYAHGKLVEGLERVEKLGKKKNWPGSARHKVRVSTSRQQ